MMSTNFSLRHIDFASLPALIVCLFLALLVFIFHFAPPSFPANAPKKVHEGYPFLGPLRYFSARWDFFREAAARSPTGNFSFTVGKLPIV